LTSIMESSFALIGKGYVLIAADTTASRSIVKMKSDEDKTKILSPHLVMTYGGEPGDTIQFAEYVERNVRLQIMRNNHEIRPQATAAWIRRTLADSLRSRNPYSVNLMLGGYDQATSSPQLFWIDYLGTFATVPYAAHGYGAYFALSTLDRYHDPTSDLETGLKTLRRCIDEIANRMAIGVGKFKVHVVDKDGAREVELPPSAPPGAA